MRRADGRERGRGSVRPTGQQLPVAAQRVGVAAFVRDDRGRILAVQTTLGLDLLRAEVGPGEHPEEVILRRLDEALGVDGGLQLQARRPCVGRENGAMTLVYCFDLEGTADLRLIQLDWFERTALDPALDFAGLQDVVAALIQPFDLPRAEAVRVAGEIEARRVSINQMMWQVPALALAAQAFLLVVILGADTNDRARVIGSLVGAFILLLTWHLFRRHRALEKHYAIWLRNHEERNGLPPLHAYWMVSGRRGHPTGLKAFLGSSARIWRWALLLFAFGYLALAAVIAFDPALLTSGSA